MFFMQQPIAETIKIPCLSLLLFLLTTEIRGGFRSITSTLEKHEESRLFNFQGHRKKLLQIVKNCKTFCLWLFAFAKFWFRNKLPEMENNTDNHIQVNIFMVCDLQATNSSDCVYFNLKVFKSWLSLFARPGQPVL